MTELKFRNGQTKLVDDARAEKIRQLKTRGIKKIKIDGEEHFLADVFIGVKSKSSATLHIHMSKTDPSFYKKRKSSREWPFRAKRFFMTKDKRYNDLNISLEKLEKEYGRKWNGL